MTDIGDAPVHEQCAWCGEWHGYTDCMTDEEFGITLDPCEHPSINGGVCAVCGEEVTR